MNNTPPKRMNPFRHLPDYETPRVTQGTQTRALPTDGIPYQHLQADQLSRTKPGFRRLDVNPAQMLPGDTAALPPEHPVRAAKGDLPQSWGPAPRATEAGGKPFK